MHKNINALLRKLASRASKLEAMKERAKGKCKQVGREARNYFCRGVEAGGLKCAAGHKHCRKQSSRFSKDLT